MPNRIITPAAAPPMAPNVVLIVLCLESLGTPSRIWRSLPLAFSAGSAFTFCRSSSYIEYILNSDNSTTKEYAVQEQSCDHTNLHSSTFSTAKNKCGFGTSRLDVTENMSFLPSEHCKGVFLTHPSE
uniref:Uncharacterized protein n=1 Tax=Nelumbo nucifera TaxID=4432 RepID=A0A822XPG9_NELNU|nr:TPA_asm: hypothetical protein HUJ06_022432 [Nelumbo nucifera]